MRNMVMVCVLLYLCLWVTFPIAQASPEPIAFWKFDETNGIVAADAAGTANGVLVNGPTWDVGITNGGLLFDGVDDYVEITGYKGIPGSASRTCCAWIKTAVPGKTILGWGSPEAGSKWVMLLDSQGCLRVSVSDGYIAASTVLSNNEWHHIAVVLTDDSSPDISEAVLYVDGHLETISSFLEEPVNTGNTQDVQIGFSEVQPYVTFFDGVMDEVCIYDQALTDSQISEISALPIPNPVFHLPLNESAGTIAPDIAGGHDGTLMNMDGSAWTAGVEGFALAFDGIDDYVEAAGYKGITGPASRTCMFWIKSVATNKEILSWGDPDEVIAGKWLILLDSDGHLRVSVNGGYIVGNTNLSDGWWHHIAVVLIDDGSPDISEAILYVDGQVEAVSSYAAAPVNTGDTQDVQVGVCLIQGVNRYFSGLIDDVRIYDVALIPRMVTQLVSDYLPICIWVDDDYTVQGFNDGHVWGVNAFSRIQDGINVAFKGNIVSVAAGTYSGPVTLKPGVEVIGSGAESCTINYNGENTQGQSIVNATDCGAFTVFQGFRITGGRYGGMSINGGRPNIKDCVFVDNISYRDGRENGGGGIYNQNSNPMITRCKFINNEAVYGGGGGIFNFGKSSPVITYCQFFGNSATGNGGGIYNDQDYYNDVNTTVLHCVFAGNTAKENGGGIYNEYGSTMLLKNCTFSGNTAAYGGAVYNQNDLILVNGILWENRGLYDGNEIDGGSQLPIIRYSDISGCGGSGSGWDARLGIDDGGNIDVNPLFAGKGDFHLQSRAGRFNSSLDGPLWIFDEYTSPCIDTGNPNNDVEYEPEGNGNRRNMGVYGGTSQASKSSDIPGDIDGSGMVNLGDFMILAENWLEGTESQS